MDKSIVVIMAHSDDIELSAGGTMAKYVSRKYKCLYGILSRCNSGWAVAEKTTKGGYFPSIDIIPKRKIEAKKAAKIYGAQFFQEDLLENCYTQKNRTRIVPSFTGPLNIKGKKVPLSNDVPTGTLFLTAAGAGASWEDNPIIQKISKILIKWKPELVIGQEIGNFNPDHFAAAQIVAIACQLARKKTKIGPYWIPVGITEKRKYTFPPITPNRFVDVTGFERICLDALSCHRSQGGHLKNTHKSVKRKWAFWGKRIHTTSAEAFFEVYS